MLAAVTIKDPSTALLFNPSPHHQACDALNDGWTQGLGHTQGLRHQPPTCNALAPLTLYAARGGVSLRAPRTEREQQVAARQRRQSARRPEPTDSGTFVRETLPGALRGRNEPTYGDTRAVGTTEAAAAFFVTGLTSLECH